MVTRATRRLGTAHLPLRGGRRGTGRGRGGGGERERARGKRDDRARRGHRQEEGQSARGGERGLCLLSRGSSVPFLPFFPLAALVADIIVSFYEPSARSRVALRNGVTRVAKWRTG